MDGILSEHGVTVQYSVPVGLKCLTLSWSHIPVSIPICQGEVQLQLCASVKEYL